jgi:probable rRNA maturation factor
MNVSFNFLATIPLNSRRKLRSFIQKLFALERKVPGDLNFIFCSDDYLLKINKTYLNHNFYTDVITFDLSENAKEIISGDIYISADRIKDNAIAFQTTIGRELHRVIFHGILHLCGYKDKSKASKIQMTAKENQYLTLYFQSLS